MPFVTPYPPQVPDPDNVPRARWFSDLVRQLNARLAGTPEGTGDPNGQIVGRLGDTFRRRDGPPCFYVKEGDDGGTGSWVPK